MTSDRPRRLLILVASPRRNGNSAVLAQAALRGAREAGLEASLHFADDLMQTFLRDCRDCRDEHGRCRIDDGYADFFFEHFLEADGFALASPVYWYGMSSQAKAFFDRMFCYVARSYPDSQRVRERIQGKRVALLTASEEMYPTIALSLVNQMQEYARYTHSQFVGAVHGQGDRRGSVAEDRNGAMAAAEALGRQFFERPHADYRVDSVR
ncbi:flavodoxin family protein [Lysobacter enzymogenes]|uniref:Flavodoxin family protein n=1 Tax=Lysobacter enzymogenes TaxID=69 RepID=A0A3N2RKW6_LYSEN|nr:flavodoxin family protein [Lysobacter enzymogenes]ROU08107.1 flavodoxin family protein [Lysobacter enzymogenes]